ncbi:EpsG family protein [Flavobacterium sp. CAN_S2]|uniref:EpsG family protein n=1 Tax=Flavobacterium sp. CAN_S2 TaxID=2787726 RepID=UPI0018CAEBF3
MIVVIVPYMGLRPISGRYFGDTSTYNEFFVNYQNGAEILPGSDYLFHLFTQLSSKIMSVHVYFLICTLLYISPLYLVCKTWFKNYWGYAFLFLVVSFSFWAGGVNGVRSSIATSFILLAFSRKSLPSKVFWFLIAVGFHKSMLLLVGAYCLTLFIKKPKLYFLLWFSSIPLSLLAAGFWESFFAGLIEDDRVSYLTAGNVNDDEFSSTGFRWDFLLYSAAAVYAAFYFIYKKKFVDENYFRLVSIYLTVNAFWILVIRANFSNRFAALSWFMMGIIIIYPLLKKNMLSNQLKVIGSILVAYFAFTFFMNVVK